jgi:hypothetical protein
MANGTLVCFSRYVLGDVTPRAGGAVCCAAPVELLDASPVLFGIICAQRRAGRTGEARRARALSGRSRLVSHVIDLRGQLAQVTQEGGNVARC